MGATLLGQLATEYLDDRRQEFNTLEKIILKDLATRKNDIKILKDQMENVTDNLKQLLRKDVLMYFYILPISAELIVLHLDR